MNTLVGLSCLTIAGTTHTGKLEGPSLLSHTKALQDFASSSFQFGGLFLVLLLTWGQQQAHNMAQGPPASPERSVVLMHTLQTGRLCLSTPSGRTETPPSLFLSPLSFVGTIKSSPFLIWTDTTSPWMQLP